MANANSGKPGYFKYEFIHKGDKDDPLNGQMDVTLEEAQLRSAEASVELARLNAERIRELRSRDTLAQSEADAAEAQLKQAVAAVEQIKAAIEKKTFRAPFAGRLGIRRANLGQFLNAGDALVSREALDPIHVEEPTMSVVFEPSTSPLVGRSARYIMRIAVDFPAPLWPVRKANSPFRTWKETFWRAAPLLGYSRVTAVNLITGAR